MTFMKKSAILALMFASLVVINQQSAEAKLLDTDKNQLFQELAPTIPINNPVKSKPIKALSARDIECLEAVIYNETRGSKKHGAILVGATVFNRVNSPLYPNTICAVAYQKHQFSNIHRIKPHHINEETRAVVREIVKKYFNGTLNKTVLSFHNTSVRPSWSYRMKRVIQVGAHIFYAR